METNNNTTVTETRYAIGSKGVDGCPVFFGLEDKPTLGNAHLFTEKELMCDLRHSSLVNDWLAGSEPVIYKVSLEAVKLV